MPSTPDAPAPPILDVRELSVAFDAAPVLDQITFSLPAGASLAVIGPNGAGKTVLFRALLGAVPHTGTVHWAPGVRIGYVPQKLDIERDIPITGRDFLTARLAVERDATERPDIAAVLRLVGLSEDTSRKPIGTISGGQFQRLLVAFALLGNPTVLLLDEPTAGIDQPGEERLNAMLHRLQQERGLTILLISHELTIVHAYATHVLCLGSGPAFFGPPSILTPDLLANLYREHVSVHAHTHAH
ncbi:MAG TPA: metal ABC transporter ATP-binding protein [Vicinamibacterales bacterium]|jgi:zinc transport system ATP-binding protein|nr:metal ABC transporter ATP-binding protein [Vicinamibacterales bacterium]